MPLRTLLYRCPRCGHDPMEGEGDRAECPGCGCAYVRAGGGGRVRMEEPEEKPKHAVASRLTEAIEALGGPLSRARDGRGCVDYGARVLVRRAHGEETLRHGGEVLGFVERFGEARPGELRVTDDALELHRDDGASARWNLLDLRAVQASSSAIQIRTAVGELVQFRFESDSAVRWQHLLHAVLRNAYRDAGRGEILEFQPRISTR